MLNRTKMPPKALRETTEQTRNFRFQLGVELHKNLNGVVCYGPLKGHVIVDEFSRQCRFDLTTKLLGYFQQQCMPALENNSRPCLVELGQSDGFWSVGLVGKNLFERSICFGAHPKTQRILRRTARANNVSDRIQIWETSFDTIDPSANPFGSSKDLFFMVNLEGQEFKFLTNDFLRKYKDAEFLIQLNANMVQHGDGRIERLLLDAHQFFQVEMIDPPARTHNALNERITLPEELAGIALSEGPFSLNKWLHLKPHTKKTAPAPLKRFKESKNQFRLASFWLGKRLGWMEHLCLLSMLKQGYDVSLFAHENVENVPEGVNIYDARDVYDPNRIIHHSVRGGVAIHSDVFRFHLIRDTNFIWTDLDMFFLKDPEALKAADISKQGYFLGEYPRRDTHRHNNALIRFPKDSTTLKLLGQIFLETSRLSDIWTDGSLIDRLNNAVDVGDEKPFENLAWGQTGGLAFSDAVRHAGEEDLCQEQNVFYPVSAIEVDQFLDPKLGLNKLVTDKTIAVHLWGSELRALMRSTGSVSKKSALYDMFKFVDYVPDDLVFVD